MKIAVIDGYSTGRYLAPLLRENNVASVHIHSSSTPQSFFVKDFTASDYDADLGPISGLPDIEAALRAHDIGQVVAGTESGVVLADQLNAFIGFTGNPVQHSMIYRSKVLMAAAAAKAGIPMPMGTECSSAVEACAWFEESAIATAVVKPVSSAGTDNVRFCSSSAEVAAATDKVLRSTNLYGQANPSVLVQERIHGTEYYLNTVSRDGQHKLAELWRYTKTQSPDGSPIYDFETPVAHASSVGQHLNLFAQTVLKGFGFRSGAAHVEVMLTDDGPVLIEIAARLGGATCPDVVHDVLSTSQTHLLALALTDRDSFVAFDDMAVVVPCAVRNVSLINPRPGTAAIPDWVSMMESLPTARRVVTSVIGGQFLPATRDLITAPGYVYLVGEQDAVQRDFDQIRASEREGSLYVI